MIYKVYDGYSDPGRRPDHIEVYEAECDICKIMIQVPIYDRIKQLARSTYLRNGELLPGWKYGYISTNPHRSHVKCMCPTCYQQFKEVFDLIQASEDEED